MLTGMGVGDCLLYIPSLYTEHVSVPAWLRKFAVKMIYLQGYKFKFEFLLSKCLQAQGLDSTWVPLAVAKATLRRYEEEWKKMCSAHNLSNTYLKPASLDLSFPECPAATSVPLTT